MRQLLKKPLFVFLLSLVIIAFPLFLFPINLFEGEIIYHEGIAENTVPAPLSLSYFIGLGYDEQDMVGVKDFYLKANGYILAILIVIGFPALLAYRTYVRNK